MDENLICPKEITKDNWIIGSDWKDDWKQAADTYSVEQRRTTLTITRTDANHGWGLKLAFHCCFQGMGDTVLINKLLN